MTGLLMVAMGARGWKRPARSYWSSTHPSLPKWILVDGLHMLKSININITREGKRKLTSLRPWAFASG